MLFIRPGGQVVKTPPFHGGNTGSNPVRVTKKETAPQGAVFLFAAGFETKHQLASPQDAAHWEQQSSGLLRC